MRVVFFGSSSFSVPVLRELARCPRHELAGAAAQPDRPSGRNRQVHVGAVHEAALDLGVPIITPEKIGSPEALCVLQKWRPDVIVVASFGQYIPLNVRSLPAKAIINVHPSLLPKYRGAAPLQWSVANGESTSGVTIFHVIKEMDAGDIVLQETHSVEPDESATELSERFSRIGARMTIEALDLFAAGNATSRPQDAAAATYAPKISKEDGRIDWRRTAREIHNRIRGFQPWPGNYFEHDGVTVKVWRSRTEEGDGNPGEILALSGDGPLIMTGEGAVRLLELQPAGKKTMTGQAFLCGHKWAVGGILDEAIQP